MISLFGFESFVKSVENDAAKDADKMPVALRGLNKTAKGLFAVSLSLRLSRPVVLVTDKAARAEELFETIRFFTSDPSNGPPPLLFPPWETLPFEEMSPHPGVSGQRLSTLAKIADAKDNFVLVTTTEALARNILPPVELKKGILRIDKGDSIDLELLADHLISFGYRRVDMVEEPGEFAFRGGIVDLFTGEGDKPARMELFGDEVESIRRYNPDTQRSIDDIDGIDIYPFREVFYEGIDRKKLATAYENLSRDQGIPEEKFSQKRDWLLNGQFFPGVERLLPLFYPSAVSLFDYLPEDAVVIIDEPENCETHTEAFYNLTEQGAKEAAQRLDPVSPPEDIFISMQKLQEEVKKREIVRIGELAVTKDDEETFTLSTKKPERYKGDTKKFLKELSAMKEEGYTLILVATTEGRARRLENFLKENETGVERLADNAPYNLAQKLCQAQISLFDKNNIGIISGTLAEGAVFDHDKWALITDDEIFGTIQKAAHRRRRSRTTFSVGLSDLSPGDLVTHETHGVGRFVRLKEMTIGDATDEYLELEYAALQKLFLPINRIDLIKKFVNAGGSTPALDKMGGATWKKTRARVKKAIMDMAGKLLTLQASRDISEGFTFSPDDAFHAEFADTFEFEETEDQKAAIEDVMADMERRRPMDRLICGDVGYGKTEVAMRAAFKAVYDKKQVAMLAPTTILAQQHFTTFAERFRSFPVSVEALSRFKTTKEAKEIVQKTAEGKIDILIGTHRLLQKDVAFPDLGLVIIDEEQRFGVRHKERLKALSKNADVLTLTATPIPRTLHTSMVGIRDLSIIETPPVDRLAIRNNIAVFSEKVVTEALTRELDRGGQVFFVHNKVRNIGAMKIFIEKLAPHARVAVAHGQMGERELEKVMRDFIDRNHDVLLATTIIESGLDIPSANTLIINRADHFGLSQLYQLRGRVGRDRRRAHCYFLIPGIDSITEVSKKRLKAIEELSELGSGFRLAARDMEIRGAGNLLGPEQSGNIDSVGFETYTEMLQDAIREIKGEETEERFDVSMNLVAGGKISGRYVPGVNHRMELYNRLFGLASLEALDDMEEELVDRFGAPPEETEKLLSHTRIKLACKRLRVEKVDMLRDKLSLVFDSSTPIKPDGLAKSAAKKDISVKFTSEYSAEVIVKGKGWRERFDYILEFLMGQIEGQNK